MNTEKRVFISYAWESDSFKESIWELAGWLEAASSNKIEVITDHLFSVKPPPEGWYRWMLKEVEKADIVLSVCSPKYKISFEGAEEEEEGGFGVTHEGLIITAKFYEAKGNNGKFFPILPDDGKFDDIPVILRAYNNSLKFSSGNQNIYNLILGENPSHTGRKAKEEEAKRINEEAVQSIQLQKEIVTELAKSFELINTDMNFDVQILIRSYLSLSDVEKEDIIKSLAKEDSPLSDDPDEKDKQFLQQIHDKSLLAALWTEVNEVNPFENPTNPFL